jgi:hypothetical protein
LRAEGKYVSWRIQPVSNPRQFGDEIKAFAKKVALAEALKQTTELQDVSPDYIERLGKKWRNHCVGMQRKIWRRYGEQLDDLLVLAWRINLFAHHYEAALVRKTLELSDKEISEQENELTTAKGCQRYYECGMLVAQHYAAIVGTKEILQGTSISQFPDTGDILEALSLDCIMHAALCLPDNIEMALDLLADSVSANDLALQGALHLSNFFNRKAERVSNGRAGARKRHEKLDELRAWALERYKSGTWRSANHAASELLPDVLKRSEEIGANLTKSNGQRTIAEWIRKSV